MEETRVSRVDVWSLPLLVPPDRASLLGGILSDEEMAALSLIGAVERRERTQFAWAMRRILIGHALRCAPRDVRIARPPGGAPILDMPGRGLHFSLSHSGNAMLFAVAETVCVGVDIEWIDDEVDAVRLARRFFTAAEADEIAGLTPTEARDAFFRLWTRKEAVLKGIGGGVPSRLRAVPIGVVEGRSAVRVGEAEWTIDGLPVPDGFAGALAVRGRAAVITHTTLGVELSRTR